MYPGSWLALAAFHCCFLALVALIFPRPRLYVYTFLAGFLFLGFWPKVVAHLVWAVTLIEPVGEFTEVGNEWDGALHAASAGALGVIAVRCGYLMVGRARSREKRALIESESVPWWFMRWRKPIWSLTLILIASVQLLNLRLAFFQVGVNPIVILPIHMNVPIAWLINIGFAIWIATLVHWDFRLNEGTLTKNLVAPIAEAFLTSVSSLSRLAFLTHAGPYVLALMEHWDDIRKTVKAKKLIRLSMAFMVLLFSGILVVFLFRIYYFHDFNKYVGKPYVTASKTQATMTFSTYVEEVLVRQIPTLFVHRWVGLEGVLTASTAANRGNDLLIAAITDDPRKGGVSLYQKLAKPAYLSSDPGKFTFLSNAGVIAILVFSGSTLIVLVGMAFLTVTLVATEIATDSLTGNPFLVSIIGAGLANVLAQTTFPYLSLLYLLQLWIAVLFLWLVQKVPIPPCLRPPIVR
jgi:hypothetical protein